MIEEISKDYGSIGDDVVKWFRRLYSSSTKCSVTHLNQTAYAMNFGA